MTSRRGFLAAILASAVAPAIVRAGVLMRVRELRAWTAADLVFGSNMRAGQAWMLELLALDGGLIASVPFVPELELSGHALLVRAPGALAWTADRDVRVHHLACRTPSGFFGGENPIELPIQSEQGGWPVTDGNTITAQFFDARVVSATW